MPRVPEEIREWFGRHPELSDRRLDDDWSEERVVWAPRNDWDRQNAEGLETFFGPYLARLEEDDRQILEATVYDRRTFDEIGALQGTTRQAAWRRHRRAVRRLVRLVAHDEAGFLAVLDEWWIREYGLPYPGVVR